MPRPRFALALVLATLPACASDVFPRDAARPDVIDVVDVACPPDRPIRCNGECVGDTDSNPVHCGATCTMCNVPDHGSATCTSGVCGIRCSPGYVALDSRCVDLPAPHPTRPLTNARVSVTQPTLHWSNPAGTDAAHITLCRDRACTSIVTAFDADGTSARVPNPLGAGVWFWNLRAIDAGVVSAARSATWSFHTPAVSGPVEWSWAERPDVNGDGIDDFAIVRCVRSAAGSLTVASTEYFVGGSDRLQSTVFSQFTFVPVGDVDADGFTDLLRETSDSTTITLLGGVGDLGSLRPMQSITLPSAGFFGWSYSAPPLGDFNGDGFADTVVRGGSSDTDRIAYGADNGWLMPFTMIPRASPYAATAASYDADADGFDDVLLPGPVWLRGGPMGLSPPQNLGTGSTFVVPLGDFDGDGYLDSVQLDAAGSGGSITLIRGGAFGPRFGASHPQTDGTGQRIIVGTVGDLDGDGTTDLLFVTPVGAAFQSVAYRGSRDGFTAADSFAPNLPCTPGPYRGALPIGDWNDNGHDDYILWCDSPDRSHAYLRLDVGTSNEQWLPVSIPDEICGIE